MKITIRKDEQFVAEGIDIDHVNGIVSYNAKHQDNVDTSVD